MAETAKLFTHGGSQAVRLPKEFRFEGSEVFVRRAGDEVILSPRPAPDVESMIAALDLFEPGTVLQREQPAPQERTAIAPGDWAAASATQLAVHEPSPPPYRSSQGNARPARKR